MARPGRSIAVMLAVLAFGLGAGAGAGAAASAAAGSPWSRPVALSPLGVVANGWLSDAGVFRTVGRSAGRDRVTTATADGHVTGAGRSDGADAAVGLRGDRTLAVEGNAPVRLLVLDRHGSLRHTFRVPGRLPELLGFTIPSTVALPGGGALVCTDLPHARGEAIAAVAPDGGSVHVSRVTAAGADPVAAATGGCYGIAAASTPGAGRAVVLEENGDAREGSGATSAQVLVQRVTRSASGATLQTPIPVLPAGEQLTVNAGEPEAAETSTGWIAVTWLSTRAVGERLETHQNLRWISPAGTLGPIVELTRHQRSIPPAVTLAPVGPRRVTALVNPQTPDREIDSYALRAPAVPTAPGSVGPRRVVFRGSRIVAPTIAGPPAGPVAAWIAARGVYASRWRAGRWSSPALVRTCTDRSCPIAAGVTANRSGRAAVYWSLVGPGPTSIGGGVAFSTTGS